MMRWIAFAKPGLAAGLIAGGVLVYSASARDVPTFNQEILPILADNCFACHGPDAPARKADLRLDQEDYARKPLPSGGTPIIPGDPAASLVIQRVTSADPEKIMPPPESGKVLTDRERDLLVRWIAEGAEWQPHWAFISPIAVAPPAVADSARTYNPVDAFVRARLESEGLAPAPEADRYTLIRRTSLALTGLPPTPREINDFVQDPDPAAYEALVDRLLASPRYGEHMARYWLDLARYADTNGYAADIERTMWRYRDWVIDAFNRNMPFNAFTVEQLAGDLLPDPALEQRIASGFNRNHPIMMEGGAIFEEYRVMNVVDRVDTTATTWLGLTMKCAQCHDHKYDPISQREFYQFYAFFNNVTEEESRLFGTELDGNSLPRMKAPLPEQRDEMARLETALAAVRTEMLRPDPDLDQAQASWEVQARQACASRWKPLDATREMTVAQEAGAGGAVTLLGVTDLEAITAVSLEFESLDANSIGSIEIAEIEVYAAGAADGGDDHRVELVACDAVSGDARPAFDGAPDTAWTIRPGQGQARALFAPGSPFGFPVGTRLRIEVRGTGLDTVAEGIRVQITSDPTYLPASLGPWYVSGPNVAETGDAALALESVNPREIDLAATTDDGSPRWKVAEDGLPDGKMHNLPGKTCATWLYRRVTSPNARSMDLALDNRNAVRFWVNGRLVLDKPAQRGEVGPHPAPVAIELRAGDNDLLVKVVDYYDFNAHTFFFARKGEAVGPMSLSLENVLMQTPDTRADGDTAALRAHYRSQHWPEWCALHARELDLAWDLSILDRQVPTTMVMEERAEVRPTHVLVRGNYDQPGEAVQPEVPAALHPWPEGEPRNRMGLARWIVSPDNPLTARVVVNRVWQRLFGEGLVGTPDDFGIQGARPSHPELLDWLAAEFMASGWDMKALQRLIVTSATFRQASAIRSDLAAADPANRLLGRGPRYRLDAEMVRDAALAASGLLVERLGGPSVKPYQPPGLWKDVAYGGGGQRYTAQEFIQDHGDKLYRRSLYTFWKRAAAPPGMLLFDAPNRDVCTARRSRSNTPLQALALMNDVQYMEAARHLAARVLAETAPVTEERVVETCLLALGRPPRPAEADALKRLYDAQAAAYRDAPEAAAQLLESGEAPTSGSLDAVELAAWTLVANALLNTDAAVSMN